MHMLLFKLVMYYVHTGNCVTLTLNFTFLPRVLIVFFYCTWILYIYIYISKILNCFYIMHSWLGIAPIFVYDNTFMVYDA